MSTDIQRQEVELKLRLARENLDMAKALERLKTNKDFKKVVTDGYFKDEAVRLVHLRCDPSQGHPAQQAQILAGIDAIGNLHAHFLSIERDAAGAQKEVEDCEEALTDIAQQEAAE